MFSLLDHSLSDTSMLDDLSVVIDELFAEDSVVSLEAAVTMALGGRNSGTSVSSLLSAAARLMKGVRPQDGETPAVATAASTASVVFDTILGRPDQRELGRALLVAIYNDGVISDLEYSDRDLIVRTPRTTVVACLAMLVIGLSRLVAATSSLENSGDALRHVMSGS